MYVFSVPIIFSRFNKDPKIYMDMTNIEFNKIHENIADLIKILSSLFDTPTNKRIIAAIIPQLIII